MTCAAILPLRSKWYPKDLKTKVVSWLSCDPSSAICPLATSSEPCIMWLLSWEQILSSSKWKVSYRKVLIPALVVFPCFSIERTWYSFANSWRKWKKVPNSFISQQSIYPFIVQCNIIVFRQHKYKQVAFCKIVNKDDSLCVVHCCGILPQS